MKRLLTFCGLAAALAVPAALASGTTVTPSCTTCAVGSTVTVTGAGFSNSASYFWGVASVNNGSQGTFQPLTVTAGQISFSFVPWAADQYEVRVWIRSGRNMKVVSDVWVTAS